MTRVPLSLFALLLKTPSLVVQPLANCSALPLCHLDDGVEHPSSMNVDGIMKFDLVDSSVITPLALVLLEHFLSASFVMDNYLPEVLGAASRKIEVS